MRPAGRFDETEYDHDLQQGRDQPKSPYQFKLRDEASSKVLREHGVDVSRDPFAEGGEQGAGDKIVVRKPCTYRYVVGRQRRSRLLGLSALKSRYMEPLILIRWTRGPFFGCQDGNGG